MISTAQRCCNRVAPVNAAACLIEVVTVALGPAPAVLAIIGSAVTALKAMKPTARGFGFSMENRRKPRSLAQLGEQHEAKAVTEVFPRTDARRPGSPGGRL